MITDAILLSITNRNTGFLSSAFQTLPEFTPSTPTSEETELREVLGLHAGWSDYAVKCALGVIDAHPLIRAQFEEPARTYSPSQFTRLPDSFSGGSLVGSPSGPAKLAREPVEWPVNPLMTFSWLDSSHASMVVGDQTHVVSWYADGELIAVDWPAASGISGRLNPSAPVIEGYTFSVRHEPVSCPFSAVRAALENSAAARALLGRTGLARAWFAADSDAERMAVACLALGRSNKAVYA